ncbi:MAG: hypothetical protein LZF86_80048 [Nitrospira sp.]|nr:MAG: hypothetical protein LZF86_80048 [Nitrospira sp.]
MSAPAHSRWFARKGRSVRRRRCRAPVHAANRPPAESAPPPETDPARQTTASVMRTASDVTYGASAHTLFLFPRPSPITHHTFTLAMYRSLNACRLFRKAVQQGRSERRGEAYAGGTLNLGAKRERRWRTFSTAC